MKNSGIVLATGSGNLLYHSFMSDHTHKLLGVDNSRLMGIAREHTNLYFANHDEIYRLNYREKIFDKIFKANETKYFHHIKVKDKTIFITSTATNSILTYDLISQDITNINIKPGENNHINSIFIQDDLYYITLNKAKSGVTGYSSIVVLDSNYKVVDEFQHGWQSHGFCILNGISYSLCGYWEEQKDLDQPKYACILVDGEVEYIFEKGEFFKDISLGVNHIYVCGGKVSERDKRVNSDGILYKFNYALKPQKKMVFKKSGDITGCLLDITDFTN